MVIHIVRLSCLCLEIVAGNFSTPKITKKIDMLPNIIHYSSLLYNVYGSAYTGNTFGRHG